MKLRYTLLSLLISVLSLAQNPKDNIKNAFVDIEDQQAELLILGTFHFKDAGLDGYKPKYDVNIMSEQKQAELSELLEDLKAYGPTKIAIERRWESQARVDSLYNEYLNGNFDLSANEIYQVGFRLAKMMGHKKVYCIDARSRQFNVEGGEQYYKDKEAYYKEKFSQEQHNYEAQINAAFKKLYEADDILKTQIPLKDFFLYLNSEERLTVGHGHYVNGYFKWGEDTDYFGPDASIWWYTRNMRIFHNLLRIKEPKDKVLLLIGAGHVPIIDFQADASVDYKKIDLADVLD